MKEKSTIGIILLAIGIILVASLWIWSSQTNLPQEQGKTWVNRHLTQCGEDWQPWVHERNQDNYKQPWEENEVMNLSLIDEGIKEFYKNEHAITLYDIQQKKTRGEMCDACSCLGNTKLFLQVADKDVSKVLEMGYKK
ncbi:MAG: hypothetical protein WDZ80_07765 [Candidatus Paceibacterota bacterium]